MAIHPYQIADLNWQFLATSPVTRNASAFASEFGIIPDNVNGQTARYFHLLSTWGSINPQASTNPASPSSDCYMQTTGSGDGTSSGQAWRPNGGYFVRTMAFVGTAVPPAVSGFRDGYIGSLVGGLVYADYSHDPNGESADYEPVYGHGVASWPMTADIAHQWLDSNSSPSDGTDSIINMSSALTRSIYMPASYMIFHIASTGSQSTGSGSLKFFMENRPSLRMTGFNDNNSVSGQLPAWSGAETPNTLGQTYPATSDPLRQSGGLNSAASDNYRELFQITGVRKLNSRGLSFHLAKVFDNGFNSFAYPYEEDGQTLGTGVVVSSQNIQNPYTYVNDQQEYVWAGGRDVGAAITSVASSGTVVTVTAKNTFSTNQIVFIQGLTNGNNTWLNGQLWTVATATSTQFTINTVHSVYSAQGETSGGIAVYNPDFRVRQAATFNINEEYYGLVMDTKCSIWSNKSSMVPLLFFDLADTWTGSTAMRIAGVATVPTYYTSNSTQVLGYQVFFLSEDGKLARYDFTQTNGVLELAGSGSFSFATNAPAVAHVGEAYGALKTRTITGPITATSATGGVLTVTAANNFQAGDVVNITGTQESGINNITYVVSATGLSTSSFQVPTTVGNYTNASDTGTATCYELWALYGTMTADPRTTQTGLVATARIGVVNYFIGTGAWGSITFSGNTGRHNGRSLSEMISPRDGKLYILCEDVSVSGGGPYTVSNAFGAVTNVNWQVQAYDPVAATWNTSKINGSSPIQYGTNFGANATSPSQNPDFWFYDINAFMHDVAPNILLVQGSWHCASVFTLNVSGSTASLSNTQLTAVASSTLFANDSFNPSQFNPATQPISITHARDYATNADRTTFFPHQPIHSNNATCPIYLAPPGFNWSSPTSLSLIQRNSYSSNPPSIQSVQQDYWSWMDLTPVSGQFLDRGAWMFPVSLTDNYMVFLRCAGGGQDGLPSNATYGRAAGQGMAFLPTYWKYSGGNWVMADSFSDASSNPYTVGAYAGGYTSTINLPYGLAVQFGPLSSTSWTNGEFHTWNMCYGNTKFARKLRSSWAQFAGQTFTNTDSRTIAQEEAITPYFIDTDPGGATWTAPTSTTPNTASLTTAYKGWTTSASWNKLDGSNVGFDASPLVLVWTPNGFATGSYAYAPANVNIVTGSNPYSWTVGSNTYTASSSSQSGTTTASWKAFMNNPQEFWQASGSPTQWLEIDLGLGNAQTVLSYGFRTVYDTSDNPSSGLPTNFQLQGSNDNSSWTTLDTRTGVSASRGYAYNVTTPGSYRYYRLNITATNSSLPSVSTFRLSTSVLQTTCNFVDLVFYSYGSQVNPAEGSTYKFLQNRNLCRGLKFEVSTNGGTSYTQITPLWRAHNGYAYSFARQTGITNLRVTVQHGRNSATSNTITEFGPFYLVDYNASQVAIDAARLGNSLAAVGTAPAASFDPNCLGIATDVANISIDSQSPNLLAPYSSLESAAVHGWWDWYAVQNPTNAPAGASLGCYKVHPFFGFTQFQNGGQDGGVQTITGTNVSINYQWGRRI